ncbi:MAG: AAA family ATPase, partial [Candidatus Parabeggiatoa sp.]|nr:AAA family ATPase [Candidatus Parabeggiatoa sp.]
NDFSGKLQIPQKLYGRDNEVKTLLQAFERIANPPQFSFAKGGSEMMLIAGYSGVGKTALVHEVHKPMTEKQGYFAAGKFEQFQKNIPYYAITQAFNAFCDYLLTESSEQLEQWREKILNAVGNNGQVLIDVIPQLELVIGFQPPVVQIAPTEMQNRFNFVFQKCIKAISQAEHPFVLFIDDLQWVDSASLNLLQIIMTNTDIQYLLFIGAYRDNEVNATHPLMITLADLDKNNVVIHTVTLDNLSFADVNALIADSLQCDLATAQSLTMVVYEKTQGNAFFTHKFMETLYQEELLTFDHATHCWQWIISQIQAKGMTDNVVELMVGRIRKLPEATQNLLKLAACIGNQFDLSTLGIISQKKRDIALAVLWEAIIVGLVNPLDEHYKRVELGQKATFQFVHDRVQQAAYSLIEKQKREATHLEIGRLLKANITHLDENLFEVLDHLNLGLALVNTSAEKKEIIGLNLQAGQKAKNATAYAAAIKYLNTGLAHLPANSWKTEYKLMLDFYTELAEATFLNTDFEKAEKLADLIIQQAQKTLEKMKAYELKLQIHAQNKPEKAVIVGLEALQILGISMAENWAIKLPELSELKNFPQMTNPHQLAVMNILVLIAPPIIFTKPQLFASVALTMTNLCINQGHSAPATYAYSLYGWLISGQKEDKDTAYHAGQIALHLVEQFQAKEFKSKVHNLIAVFVAHWKKPLRSLFAFVEEGIKSGLETGDIEYASYNIKDFCTFMLLSGEPLESVKTATEPYKALMFKLNRGYSIFHFCIWRQLLLNFQGEAADKMCLVGDSFDETEKIPHLRKMNDNTTLFVVYLAKIILRYFFKDYQQCVADAKSMTALSDSVIGFIFVSQHNFYYSLALLALYPDNNDEEQQQILNQVTANQEKMKLWVFHAPMNYQHKYDLVEAEKARVLGENWQAIELYEKAIIGAKENEYRHEEALAYELAAEFYLAKNLGKSAQTYIRDAHYCYRQWGATAKVKDLEARYPQIIEFITPEKDQSMLDGTMTVAQMKTIMASTIDSTSLLQTTSTLLDLESVMKASYILSGEIVLSRLLEKMMHTVIENAGASRGLLILEKEEQWVIEAEGTFNIDEVTMLQSLPIEGCLPTTIVNYVVRSGKPVVLANAMREGIYTEDSYIHQHQLKSVLCSPILHQGQLIGLLYLENNLTESAFTPARLKIIDMLSSQAAISLENALLYRTLEQKVEKRTAQLAGANQEITLLNERLKEENLRMGAELDVAKKLQQMVLPKEEELQQIEGLDIAGFMEPADEVGGDYYEVLCHDGHIKIGIGDVTGHGLESGILMLVVQIAVQSLLESGIKDSENFLNILNRIIYN